MITATVFTSLLIHDLKRCAFLIYRYFHLKGMDMRRLLRLNLFKDNEIGELLDEYLQNHTDFSDEGEPIGDGLGDPAGWRRRIRW